jgi:hypothetical protein
MVDRLPSLIGLAVGLPIALSLVFLIILLGYGLGKFLSREDKTSD